LRSGIANLFGNGVVGAVDPQVLAGFGRRGGGRGSRLTSAPGRRFERVLRRRPSWWYISTTRSPASYPHDTLTPPTTRSPTGSQSVWVPRVSGVAHIALTSSFATPESSKYAESRSLGAEGRRFKSCHPDHENGLRPAKRGRHPSKGRPPCRSFGVIDPVQTGSQQGRLNRRRPGRRSSVSPPEAKPGADHGGFALAGPSVR
jgi:hypothetical protein